VTGVDDMLVDGDVGYAIQVLPAISDDTRYHGLDADDVSLVNRDNDTIRVVGRHLFYNRSWFDKNDPDANEFDDDAIATNKSALLPGEKANFANYSSYSRGINGIMIDVDGLKDADALSASDFVFRMGNTASDPADWPLLTVAPEITVRSTDGVDSSDRITLIWPDNTIQQRWLRVEVLATENTGLATADVHYWGNQIGETGNAPGGTVVNSADVGLIVQHQTGFRPAGIENPYDIDRSNTINTVDVGFAIAKQTGFVALRLIDAPGQANANTTALDTVDQAFGEPESMSTSDPEADEFDDVFALPEAEFTNRLVDHLFAELENQPKRSPFIP
jgi:hypothetical protein